MHSRSQVAASVCTRLGVHLTLQDVLFDSESRCTSNTDGSAMLSSRKGARVPPVRRSMAAAPVSPVPGAWRVATRRRLHSIRVRGNAGYSQVLTQVDFALGPAAAGREAVHASSGRVRQEEQDQMDISKD